MICLFQFRSTSCVFCVLFVQICNLMMKKGIQPTRLDQERVPYLVDNKLWVGYEDIDSIKEKVNHGRYTEDRLKTYILTDETWL